MSLTVSPRVLALWSVVFVSLAAGCGTDAVTPNNPPLDAAVTDTGASPDVPGTSDTGVTTPEDVAVADAGVADAGAPPVMSSSCDTLRAGTVDGFMVGGLSRQFILTLPTGATAPGGRWPVVFNWHGLGDTAQNMNQLLAGAVNNPTMPFILVTPASTRLGPTTVPLGIEWDNIQVREPNREAQLFDAVLRCVGERWGVDADRVYTVGFSAGAIMSDLLGVLRGDRLAGIVSYSGAYFSNAPNRATLGGVGNLIQWPATPVPSRYAQLMLSGGTMDLFSLVVAQAHFDQFAANDSPYLRASGHDVIYCTHGRGHTVPSGVMAPQLVEFFAAHPRTVMASPWAAGLPMSYPSYCTFQARGGS